MDEFSGTAYSADGGTRVKKWTLNMETGSY